jgi:cytochrome c553
MLVAVTACAKASAEQLADDDTGRARYEMRQHLDDLRTIEQMTLAGKLEPAKTLAFFLTQQADIFRDHAEGRDIAFAASTLMNVTTQDEALDAELRVAQACAHCHQRLGASPKFPGAFDAPPDRLDVDSQMKRHQWAVDRMFNGLIGPDDEQWRAGIYVFATSPLQRLDVPDPDAAKQLQMRARKALDARGRLTIEQRAGVYRELLAKCVACHTTAQ